MTTFAFPAVLTTQDSRSTITAYDADSEQPVKTADSAHPHFEAIVQGLKDGDPAVWDLFDVAGGVMRKLRKITDRFSWNGAEVLFDGDVLHETLADQMNRAIEEGLPMPTVIALARFYEKLQANPVEHSREQAYKFLASHQFQITGDGNVVGFKGVYRTDVPGVYRSGWSSRVAGVPSAWVDGVAEPELSTVRNPVGATVSMPRSEVVHDPSVHCARGLHVSTQSYARGYGEVVLEVEFDPGKLVSVPNDSGEKVRVHEYTIRRVALGDDNYGDSTVLVESDVAVGWAGDVGTKV